MVADRRLWFSPADWRLRTRLLVLFGATAAFLATAVTAVLLVSAGQRDELNNLIDDLIPATAAVRDLQGAVNRQEAGVKGFLLTGDDEFRTSVESSQAEAAEAFADLDAVIGRSEEFRPQYDEIEASLAEWRAYASDALADMSTEAQADGLRRFERVRAATGALETDLQNARMAVAGDLQDSANTITRVTIIQVAGIVVLAGLVVGALTRLVLVPIEHLRDDVRKVAAGDLDREVAAGGSPELRQLGDDIDAMRRRIVAELDEIRDARGVLEQQASDLRRSNDDLEQFAYVASHDLQEPLRKVSSFCQLLQRRYGGQLDDRADEYIAYAVDGAKRMQDLINDLLAFSRVGRTTERFERLDLNEVVDDVRQVLAPSIEDAGAKVMVGSLPQVDGDRSLLANAFQNLIGNAIKFRGSSPPEVTIGAEATGDGWEITVSDNGIGIDPQYGEKIFTIFQRLHGRSEYSGTGIGLSVAQKIVEFHGGAMRLVPSDPPGATFAITLPKRRELDHEP